MRLKNIVLPLLLFVFFFFNLNMGVVFGDTFIEYENENVDNTEMVEEKEKINWLVDFKEITEEELQELLKTQPILSSTRNINSETLYLVFENGEKYHIKDTDKEVSNYLILNGVSIETVTVKDNLKPEKSQSVSILNSTGFWMIIFVSLIFGIPLYMNYRQRKQAVSIGGSEINSEKTTKEIPSVKFEDVEGIEELKADIFRIVDCLKNPDKYQTMGARIPKGIILYGPPGTGKTLIAKAIAGEASVPFFSMVGSDFVEKYVGIGASRVRELYKKARKAAPCIVFIDEIDAVAGQRGQGENSERDQTINALLAELDGFKGTENIITICATNRLDMLDSAFKRAGRFDLKLAVGLPDKKGRKRILEIHSKNKKLSESVNLDNIADKTVGFSGAELEALLNESALVAVGKNKEVIEYSDIDDAFFKIVMQGNKKKREEVTDTNRVVAWHEAGHTLATKLLTNDTVSSVTIIGSSSGAGGVTFRSPKEDNILYSREYLENLVQVMYAGRAAEEIYFKNQNSITTGASQDIKQATSILKEYLSLYGMGSLGMIDLTQFKPDFEVIVNEASQMAKNLYDSVLELLLNNYETLKVLAENLLEKETLVESEINALIVKG